MQFTSSKESQYLFTLYEMCRRNVINQSQKGDLKDLLIQGDKKTQEILEIYQKNANKSELEKGILELLDQSDGSYSIYSIPSQYKSRRPKPVQVQTLEKNWACKSQEFLKSKPNMHIELNKHNKAIKERYSFNHLQIQYKQKNQLKRLSDNFYIESVNTGF
ncbi:unnamed protein product [Paramecium sonneborni]|uniref:Uncharacterized protein n=1 Tax=Paramecium sonneborni TaxID=65129 RepID=A0A8S1KM11_9CILI|nr:unnamed protein product [Paramecium sonneborni]